MAVTEKNITSTGATSYTFEFEYLKTADVKVSVNGTATTEFTVPNGAPTTVQFNSGHVPASGAAIRIYRDTDVNTLSATFYAGSAIKSQDLNDNFNQNLFVHRKLKEMLHLHGKVVMRQLIVLKLGSVTTKELLPQELLMAELMPR